MILSIDLGKKFKVSNSNIRMSLFFLKKVLHEFQKKKEGSSHKSKKVAFELI